MELTVEYLEKKLKEKEKYKAQIENEYWSVIGQLALLHEQIEDLKKKAESDKK